MKLAFSFLVVFILAASSALAAEPSASLAQILEQQRGIRSALDAGTLGDLTPRQANAIRKAQTEVFALTDGKAELDALSMEQKIQLENALQRIRAEMKGTRQASAEQEVCWREPKIGSAVKVTRCATQAERDRLREDARTDLARPRICPDCLADDLRTFDNNSER